MFDKFVTQRGGGRVHHSGSSPHSRRWPLAILVAFCVWPILAACDGGKETGRDEGPAEAALDPIPLSDADLEADTSLTGESGTPEPIESAEDIELEGTAPPAEPSLIQVTEPGCCTQVSFGADSRSIRYIDQPGSDQALGVWTVTVPQDAAAARIAPTLFTDEIGAYSQDMAFRIEYGSSQTALVRMADGERWTVPAAGRPVAISPGRTNIAWQVSPPNQPYERRTTRIWVAALDGSEARELTALARGSVSAWLNDQELLVRGRERLDAEEDVLWALSLEDASLREIARAPRLRGELPSIDGSHIAFFTSRQENPEENGVWIVSSRGGDARMLDDDLFGAYRWRDDGRLIVVPQEMNLASHRLVEVDALSLDTTQLTEPASLSFKIANGDWTVAPDGSRVAFVESSDKSIRVIELP